MVGRTLTHFLILEKLGEGGMGVVYRARDQELNRDVAVKVLPHGMLADEAARKRFRKEALALGRLNHPNIEVVYEFGSESGTHFVVTEYIAGTTLKPRTGDRTFTEPEIRDIGAQIASALAEAHQQGVLHCDLKPANVMLTPKGHVKLIDFGLAHVAPLNSEDTTESQTQQGIAGTLPYLAPERLRREPPTPQTDIYAAGAILYEIATGRRPFEGTSAAEVVASILYEAPPPVHAANPGISPGLERIIARCLEKSPATRPSSALELRAELAPPGTAVTREQLPSGKRRRRFRRWALELSAAGMAAAFAAFWIIGNRPALSFSPREWILTADFENHTGDPLFDRSLADAFTISLEQSRHVNVYPRSRITEALRRMGKKGPLQIDERIARELCVREGIRGLVTSGISKVGERYALSARLLNPATGDTVRSYLVSAKNQDGILDALDAIANRIRRDLGESLSAIQRSQPLPNVTTSSLQALKCFSDGRDLWAKNNFDGGLRLYQQAVAMDPDFAAAHAALAGAYCSHIYNNRPKCIEHYGLALQRSDRTTERERMLLKVEAESNIGKLEEAVRLSKEYLDRYPDDWMTRYNLGTTLMRNSREEEAILQLKQALRLAPRHAATHINLATCYIGLSKYKESLASYSKAFELEPGWIVNSNLNHEYGFALVKSGDAAKAREIFALAVAKPELKQLGLRSTAMLDLYEGKWRDAVVRLRESILLNHARKGALSEARDRFHLATILGARDGRQAELAELDRATAVLESGRVPQPWLAVRLGIAYARAGAFVKAARILRNVRSQVEPRNEAQAADLHRLEGELELARGNAAGGIELLLVAERESRTVQLEVASLAYAYDRSRQTDNAITAYQKLLADRDECLGWEAQHPWMAAHYRLAELYASKGERAKALDLLDALARLWKNGDPHLPLAESAARLRSKLAQP